MARRRRAEAAASARALDITHLEWLGLPEGEWREDELRRALTAILNRLSPDLLYAPSRIDFHPEHYRVAHCLAGVLDAQRAGAVPIVRIYQVQVPLTPILANLVAATGSVMDGSLVALDQYATQAGSLLRCLRMKRYAALWYGVAHQAEEFWELTAAEYWALHRAPPRRPLVRTFRGLGSFALTDPLAYMRGVVERCRLARLAAQKT
jgi:LmbE family N-acetylglucosaminyl deacetylase